jgi:hypothetical protein
MLSPSLAQEAGPLAGSTHKIPVVLEAGRQKVIASALDWPGWARAGRDEASALQALADYGPRYQRAVGRARLGFKAPADVTSFTIAERLPGNATTDFGVPGLISAADQRPVSPADLRRLQAQMRAIWRALDAAQTMARGHRLRLGPRGGGRQLDQILDHVLEANHGYLKQVGWQPAPLPSGDPSQVIRASLDETLRALPASAAGELPAVGPRGGRRWPARYFARRAAWHVLDHVWEIEDRLLTEGEP